MKILIEKERLGKIEKRLSKVIVITYNKKKWKVKIYKFNKKTLFRGS